MSIVRALKSESILRLDRKATNTWVTYLYFECDLLKNEKLFPFLYSRKSNTDSKISLNVYIQIFEHTLLMIENLRFKEALLSMHVKVQ